MTSIITVVVISECEQLGISPGIQAEISNRNQRIRQTSVHVQLANPRVLRSLPAIRNKSGQGKPFNAANAITLITN